MRYGIPTCDDPIDPNSMYVRCMFHDFFWGPFKDEDTVVAALKTLDKADPYWDYDCFCIVHGMTPLPEDYVYGFPFISQEQRDRIEKRRVDSP